MTAGTHHDHEEAARDYLRKQLGDRAPAAIYLAGRFNERPLEGEGLTSLFSFESAPAGRECVASRYYVAVGDTEPNYFPAYALSADDAYSLHVGTRFMLVMAIERVDDSLEPPAAREQLRQLVETHLERDALGEVQLSAVFRCEDERYTVHRAVIDGRELYAIGGDLSPGFYDMCAHPPQAALRLHLGKLIRREARQAAHAGDAEPT